MTFKNDWQFVICICYWVSVLIIVRPFTVWFKTRIHLTCAFWFNNEFSFSVFHWCNTLLWVLPKITKACFPVSFNHHHLCNTVWVSPKSQVWHCYGYAQKHKCAFHYPSSFRFINLAFVRSCPNVIYVTDRFWLCSPRMTTFCFD